MQVLAPLREPTHILIRTLGIIIPDTLAFFMIQETLASTVNTKCHEVQFVLTAKDPARQVTLIDSGTGITQAG